MRRSGGFIMVIALVYAVILTVVVMAMAYFIASETRGVGFLSDDTKALYLAQAGVERAFREIRDEVITPPQSGTADLRGATTSVPPTNPATNPYNVRYIEYVPGGTINGTATNSAVITRNKSSYQVDVRTFDANYTQARIISVFPFISASRATGGTGATIVFAYTTNNWTSYTTIYSGSLPSSLRLAVYPAVPVNIAGSVSWDILTNPTNSNFKLGVWRTAGNRNVYVDAMWLRVTYDIDTNTEPWHTGSYDTFPKVLGDGFIQSVSIVDEARKVNLNTASQALLNYLMQERGIPAVPAGTLATAIVNHRGASPPPAPGADPFDSVEELQQVPGMTTSYYNLIKDYVTVYSFINQYEQRPVDNWYRAPVNINTAPVDLDHLGNPYSSVLRAIFDPIIGMNLSARLAADIVSQRQIAPFKCFYNSSASPTDYTVFYNFMVDTTLGHLSYLSTAQRNQILDNADASSLIPVSRYAGMSEQTTEFCYANTTYRIESVGKIAVPGPVTSDIDLRVSTIVGNDGSRVFPVYAKQPQSAWKGYWKENYE